ncbi:MAG: GPW/gp25 family protein [Uliginosibacterium sp.]|nr:GPW/gp25 family protein [Uliginosibacterium sp.]
MEYLAASGFSFGIPALAGRVLGQDDIFGIRANIILAIKRFEPRIDPESVDVKIANSIGDARVNVLVIQISGRLWFKPSAIGFQVRTLMDLDRGDFRIDTSGTSERGE